jgi:hypothetical protein
LAIFKSREIQISTKSGEYYFVGECYEKALSGSFVQWYQIQNGCVDGIKK